MAFNANFTISESITPGVFTLTDSSVGSDPNLTQRTIRIYKSDGNEFVSAIIWPIADSSITLSILDKDYALTIIVSWASSSPLPSPSTYTANKIYAFTSYGENFYGGLTQLQSTRYDIIQDKGYYYNKMVLRVELDSAVHAINYLQDVAAAQSCIERYQYLITNEFSFF